TSRMALHYVHDLAAVCKAAHRALVPGGRLLFSVVHPVLSASDQPIEGPRTDQLVDDYFVPGPRERQWFNRPVTWYHRTVEQYITTLIKNSFAIDGLREGEPVEALFDGDRAEFQRRQRVPVFLIINARRVA
ncbi:MAG: SAM-dependent methyltransferase, partial [Acidimicrobiales bacterium]